MSTWLTRTDLPGLASLRTDLSPSPGLLLHKWHAYEISYGQRTSDHTKARIPYFDKLRELVDAAYDSATFKSWRDRYYGSLHPLDGSLQTLRATTAAPLLVGAGANPALETGLQLHPLYGVPMIPGSAVKGLAHHVAEAELGARYEEWATSDQTPEDDELGHFLAAAREIRQLFGSLTVERHVVESGEDGEKSREDVGWVTPLSLIRKWISALETGDGESSCLESLRSLLEHTGGRLRFYDAYPVRTFSDDALLVTDILNPHYPEYLREGAHPPSDDQDPIPFYFATVRPEVVFEFPYRYSPLADASNSASNGSSPGDALRKVEGWLQEGLTEWGLGAKTAAGYGYFVMGEKSSEPLPLPAPSSGVRPLRSNHTPEPEIRRGATLSYEKNTGKLKTGAGQGMAWVPLKKIEQDLPESFARRLRTRPIKCDVTVLRKDGQGIVIVAVAPLGEGK